MGLKNMLNKIFLKDKKVVICGLDNAGKSTMVSFLQEGTYIEHTPTMGKDQKTVEVQGIRINLIDMGGQKDFRSLWLGEMSDAQCVIFMIDAADQARFKEAKAELWKLSEVFKKKPLIVLANKYDLKTAASVGQIIEVLNLKDLPSFEVLQISCKTGLGIVDAFTKIYFKLTGRSLDKKTNPKALTVYDKLGVPLTTKDDQEILKGGILSAIADFVKTSYNSDLNSVTMHGHLIVVQKTKNFMGTMILDESENTNTDEVLYTLKELLEHLEHMCPELDKNKVNREKIDFLVQQYATNIL
jgi:small GTP-binding protein